MKEDQFFGSLNISEYPLPIAFELDELRRCPDNDWWRKCKQLAFVFEIALRYCTVIGLCEYMRSIQRNNDIRSAEFDVFLAGNIGDLTIEIVRGSFVGRRVSIILIQRNL